MSLAPRIDRLDKNYVINGALQFFQRGTTSTVNLTTATSSTVLVADRFKHYVNRVTNNQNYTFAQQADVPAETGFVFPYSIRALSNQAHTFTGEDRIQPLGHFIEGSMLDGIGNSDTIYVRFWFKASLVGSYPCQIGLSSNGTSVVNSYVATFSYTTAAAWQLISVPVTLPGTVLHRGTGLGIGLSVAGIAGSTSVVQGASTNTWLSGDYTTFAAAPNWATNGGYVMFAGLSVAKVALASHAAMGRNYVEELQLCQRYYEKSYNPATALGTVTSEGAYFLTAGGGGQVNFSIPFKVPKRVNPTALYYSPITGAAGVISNNGANLTVSLLASTSNVLTSGSGATGTATVSAHFTADAEI